MKSLMHLITDQRIDFDIWLKQNKKVCVTGIDTRVLTKKIRNSGAKVRY